MKKILFASTATAALAIGGMASAQGISLFGDARLGLGYNINNDGTSIQEGEQGYEDLRAVSRVRFGVNMTGETNSGITFGATIRADNSSGGQGGTDGQRAGSVFVSGAWGTLTMGDTNGADEQNVGDVTGNFSLTGFGDPNETLFISNGGSFGDDSANFASNPFARPTIRYDYDFASFGFSLSSNRDLTDVGVGVSWTGEFAGGSVNVGAGYYDFEEFSVFGSSPELVVVEDVNGDEVTVVGESVESEVLVEGGEQYSGTIGASFELFDANVIYTSAESGGGDASFDQVLVGVGTTFGDFQVGGYYTTILEAEGGLENRDGSDAFGITAAYDLGGGATVAGGVGQAFGTESVGSGENRIEGVDGSTIADFGIRMAF